jgi:outer membrane scaffolding protein for murein synthesis (MipA/OmpV family)
LRSSALAGATGQIGLLAFVLWAWAPGAAFSQTPSPLQDWQYSRGVALMKLFRPDLPDWQVEVGAAAEYRPLYDGARIYRGLGGPVIDIQYRDIAFASVGDGLGYNFLRGENYRAGISVGYDLGRRAADDLTHLKGIGNISAAPVVKLFGSYTISKEFPLVLRANVRQFVGGADGLTGDLGAYLPLPGSSEKFFMFAGPSITFADHLHMQTVFGVNGNQSRSSIYPAYMAHGGANAVGFGFSATRVITKNWVVNADLAANRLLGSASESPITQNTVQGVLALSFAYKW